MLKQTFPLLAGLIVTITATAQQNPGYRQLKKMTPAELEAYKQKMIREAGKKALVIADKSNRRRHCQ